MLLVDHFLKGPFQIWYPICIFSICWIVYTIADISLLRSDNVQQIIPRKENKSNYLLLWYAPPFWAPNMKPQRGLKNCVFKNCDISLDRSLINKSDVLLFHHADLNLSPPSRTENQMWIFFSMESPHHINERYKQKQWNNAFNWTWSYRQDSDIFTPYAKLSKRLTLKDKNYTVIFEQKSKDVAWVVSNCNTHSQRMKYVITMKKYINVDIYGRCGKPCSSSGDNCIKKLSSDYKFYLSFENSLCDDYVTEKAFRLYKDDFNIVPVIRGCPNIKDILPKDTFITTFDFSSPKTLALHIKDIALNETKYSKYIKAKDEYVTTSYKNYIQDGTCLLCENINNNRNGRVDLSQWILKKQCISPIDHIE
ncbi:glycoprotein 3-alpha-L-fucosyltransferase A-like [Mytilus trossulus]|uniref:glycoprotein 3-alpha-L-fucosyltransferase A-like n=1 Tax=Mytilus trossulus TaxID=6551 RepID=UPI0030060123